MEELEIFDAWVAAYAVCTGVPLLKVKPEGWGVFIFDNTDGQASGALGEWKEGTNLVPAKKYKAAYLDLKRKVRQAA